jgi:hypothetical protein
MSVSATLATTAVVGMAAGTAGYAGYFKGYLDATEHHQKYLETERFWRLIWDKQIVYMRQLLVGKLRATGDAYTSVYLTRLLANISEMKTALVTIFPEDKVAAFTTQLSRHVQSINNVLTTTATTLEPPSNVQAAELRAIDNAMADALNGFDSKLFNIIETRALFYEFTLRILRMIELERAIVIKDSMIAYTDVQSFAANLANYFANAISIMRFPIRKWI